MRTMDNIQVAIRVRPLIAKEKSTGQNQVWTVTDNVLEPLDQNGKPGSPYTFDRIFDEHMTTYDVFQEIAKPIIDAAVEGFHGTIFAYGQSSSGKTFTMSGNAMNPGVIKLAVNEIFSTIDNIPDREFLVRCCYMEIYNERVSDLLSSEDKTIKLQEDTERNVNVIGIEERLVKNQDDLNAVLKEGEARRHMAETKQNDRSSRSHCILRIIIESRQVGDETAVMVAHLNFVDLAGSEKAGENSGDRFREGCSINKSLFTLARIIGKLSDGVSNQHIGYRDSKLTRILQNALGGNSKTAIIATITPASLEESHSTLKFAARAKTISNKPIINEVLTDAALLKKSQKEILKLQQLIKEMQSSAEFSEKEDLEKKLKEKEEVEQKYEDLKNNLKYIINSGSTQQKESIPQAKRRRTWCPGKGASINSPRRFSFINRMSFFNESEEVGIENISPPQIRKRKSEEKFKQPDIPAKKHVSFSQSPLREEFDSSDVFVADPIARELLDLQDKYEELLNDHETLKKEKIEMEEYHKLELESNKDGMERMLQLEAEEKQSIEEKEKLKNQVVELEIKLQEEEKLNSEHQKSLKAMEEKMNTVLDEVFQLEHKLQIQNKKASEYQCELDEFRQTNSVLKDDKEKQTASEIQNLKQSLDLEKQDHQAVVDTLNRKVEELEKLHCLNDNFSVAMEDLKFDHEKEIRQLRETHEEEVMSYKIEIDDLKTQLTNQSTDEGYSKASLEDMEKQLEQQKDEYDREIQEMKQEIIKMQETSNKDSGSSHSSQKKEKKDMNNSVHAAEDLGDVGSVERDQTIHNDMTNWSNERQELLDKISQLHQCNDDLIKKQESLKDPSELMAQFQEIVEVMKREHEKAVEKLKSEYESLADDKVQEELEELRNQCSELKQAVTEKDALCIELHEQLLAKEEFPSDQEMQKCMNGEQSEVENVRSLEIRQKQEEIDKLRVYVNELKTECEHLQARAQENISVDAINRSCATDQSYIPDGEQKQQEIELLRQKLTEIEKENKDLHTKLSDLSSSVKSDVHDMDHETSHLELNSDVVSQITELQEENKQLKIVNNEIPALQSQINTLQEKLADNERLVCSLKQENIQEVTCDKCYRRESVGMNQSQRADYSEMCDKLSLDNSTLQNKLDCLQVELKNCRDQIKQYEQEISTSEFRLRESQEELKRSSDQIVELTEQINRHVHNTSDQNKMSMLESESEQLNGQASNTSDRSKINMLESEMCNLKHKLDIVMSENLSLKDKLEEQNKITQNDLDESTVFSEVNILKEQLEESENTVSCLKQENENMKMAMTNMCRTSTSESLGNTSRLEHILTESFNKTQSESGDYSEMCEKLTMDNVALQDKVDYLQEEISNYQDQIKQNEQKIMSLEDQLKDTQGECEKGCDQIKLLEEKLSSQKEQNVVESSHFQEDFNEVELRQKLNDFKIEIGQLKDQLKETNDNNNVLNLKLLEAEDSTKKYAEMLHLSTQKEEGLMQEVMDLTKNCQESQQLVQQYKEELEAVRQQHEKLQVQTEEDRSKLSSLTELVHTLQDERLAENTTLSDHCLSLENQMQTLQADRMEEVTKLTSQCDSLLKELQEMRLTNEKLQSELGKTEQQLSQVTQDMKSSENELIKEYQNKLLEKDAVITNMSNTLTNMSNAFKGQGQMEQKFEEKYAIISNLLQKEALNNNTVRELQVKLEESKTEISKLKNSLQQADAAENSVKEYQLIVEEKEAEIVNLKNLLLQADATENTLKEYQVIIEEKEAEIANLKNLLERDNMEENELIGKLQEKETEIDSLKRYSESSLENAAREYQIQLKERETEISDLKTSYEDSMKKAITEYQAKVTEQETELTNLKKLCESSVDDAVGEYRLKLEEKQTEITNLRKYYESSIESTVKEYQRKVEEKEAELTILKSDQLKEKSFRNYSEKDTDISCSVHGNDMTMNESVVKEFQDKLAEKDSEITVLKDLVQKERVKELQYTVSDLETKLKEYQKKISILEQTCQRLQSENSSAIPQILKEEIKRVQTENQELKNNYDQFQMEEKQKRIRFMSECKSQRAKISKQDQTIKDLLKELDEVDLKAAGKEIKEKLEKEEKENDKLWEELEQTRKELKKLEGCQEQVMDLQQQLVLRERQLADKEAELKQALNSAEKGSKTEFSPEVRELADQKRQNFALRMELEKIKDSLKESKTTLSETVERYESRISSLKSEIRRLQESQMETTVLVSDTKKTLFAEPDTPATCQNDSGLSCQGSSSGAVDHFHNLLLKGENQRLEKETKKLSTKLERMEGEISKLKEKLQVKCDENEKLRRKIQDLSGKDSAKATYSVKREPLEDSKQTQLEFGSSNPPISIPVKPNFKIPVSASSKGNNSISHKTGTLPADDIDANDNCATQ